MRECAKLSKGEEQKMAEEGILDLRVEVNHY
jgi:hypothetical protein